MDVHIKLHFRIAHLWEKGKLLSNTLKAKSPSTISTHNHPELDNTRDKRDASSREETQVSTCNSQLQQS